MSLDLKISAVVTGGGTGIGRAVAERIVRDGGEVWITGRRADVLETAADEIGAHPVVFDATRPEEVRAALAALPARVDLLVNNAGGNTDFRGPADAGQDTDPLARLRASWLANLESNLLGPVLVTEALSDRLADGARVVNIGSIAARQGAGSYGAAKAGVEAWTADLCRTLGPRGITVNAVSPGLIEDTGFFAGQLTDERRAMLVERTATGRAGTVDDVAELVAFLATPGAGHITGQVLPINGGAQLAR